MDTPKPVAKQYALRTSILFTFGLLFTLLTLGLLIFWLGSLYYFGYMVPAEYHYVVLVREPEFCEELGDLKEVDPHYGEPVYERGYLFDMQYEIVKHNQVRSNEYLEFYRIQSQFERYGIRSGLVLVIGLTSLWIVYRRWRYPQTDQPSLELVTNPLVD